MQWMSHLNQPEAFDLWLADMDLGLLNKHHQLFVKQMQKVNNFTYKLQYQKYEDAIIKWYSDRYNAKIQGSNIVPSPSLFNMWGCILMAFTNPGDKILVMSPLYNPYLTSIINSKRQLLSSSLVIKQNRYEINWEDLKEKYLCVRL